MSVIFTNGCFDILHRGHIELFKFCQTLGNKVIVGLNSDASVRRLKGSSRPINNEEDRKYILESLRCIDEVIIFDEDTPLRLIQEIKPDTLVKGGDYQVHEVIGNKLLKVVIYDYKKGHSTTSLIERIITSQLASF